MVTSVYLTIPTEYVPTDSSPRGGYVSVYVFDTNKPSLPTPFNLFSCLFLSLSPFNCVSFHKFSRAF